MAQATSSDVIPVVPPNLPVAPREYHQRHFDYFNNVLKLFFSSISNAINANVVTNIDAVVPISVSIGILDLSDITGFNVAVDMLITDITSILFPATVDDGETLWIRLQQSATAGPFNVNGWPANVMIANGGLYTMSPGAGQYDLLVFHYDATSTTWFEQSRSQNM